VEWQEEAEGEGLGEEQDLAAVALHDYPTDLQTYKPFSCHK
jgi:hypothetical protein